eukprot:8055600-Alexandrium_andersonii.AAC.1
MGCARQFRCVWPRSLAVSLPQPFNRIRSILSRESLGLATAGPAGAGACVAAVGAPRLRGTALRLRPPALGQ